MQGKKRYLALILFLIIGLVTFSFANPNDELEPVEENVKKVSDNSNNEVEQTEAEKAVEQAELRPSEETVEEAEEIIEESVTNTQVRQELTQRLEVVEEAIDASELIATVERMVEESENRDDILASEYYFDTNDIEKITGNMDPGDVKDNLQDRIDNLNDIFDDETAPTIKGIENGETTKNNVKITIEDTNEVTTTVTLNNEKIDFADEFNKEGVYEINVVDKAHHASSITFTIDKTNPIFENLASREVDIEYYKVDITDATDTVITLQKNHGDWIEIEEGYELTEEATYQLKAVDAAGNTYTTWIHIDKTAPEIYGVDKEYYNTCVNISAFDKYLNTVDIDGTIFTRKGIIPFEHNSQNENFTFVYPNQICTEGTHTIIARDKSNKEIVKTFTIDTTAPTYKFYKAGSSSAKDEIQPKIIDGKLYFNQNVRVVFEEKTSYFTQYIHNDFVNNENKTTIKRWQRDTKNDGEHTMKVTDALGQATEITFTVDTTPIAVTSASMYTNGKVYGDTYYATKGQTITAYVRLYEKSETLPVITLDINGKKIVLDNVKELFHNDEDKAAGIYKYEGTYTIPEDMEINEKEVTYSVTNITDKVGNKTEVDKVSGTNIVKVDTTIPKITNITIRGGQTVGTGAKTTYYAKKGAIIYLNVYFKEELPVKPVFVLNGTKVVNAGGPQYNANSKTYNYFATWELTDELAEGLIKVEVKDFSDKAGNTTTYKLEEYKMDSQSRVIVDNTAPTFRFTKFGSSLVKDEIEPDIVNGVYYFYEPIRLTINDNYNLRAHGINSAYDDKNPTRTGWLTDLKEYGEYIAIGTDTAGARSEIKIVIKSKDEEAPVITLNGDETIYLALGENYVEPGVKVIDNIDGESTLTTPKLIELYNINNQLVGTVDAVDTAIAGKYVLTYQATDKAGNISNEVKRTIEISSTIVKTPEQLRALFADSANVKDKIIHIRANLDMTNIEWKAVNGVGFTIEGNGHIISNLTYETDGHVGIFANDPAANDVSISNLIIDNAKLSTTSTAEYTSAGFFVGYADRVDSITIKNCEVKNSTISGPDYVGGFVGYTAGYNVITDGPVYADILIENSKLIDSTLTGGGSTGGAVGHSGGNVDTTVIVRNFTAENNTITGERVDKTGIVIGTANVGKTYLEKISYSNNTVFGTANSNTVTGRFVPAGSGIYVYEIPEVETLTEALANAYNGQTIKISNDIKLDTQLDITAGKTVRIDLNDKKLTITNNNALSAYTLGGTTYYGRPRMIQNYGTLEISNGTIINETIDAFGVIDNRAGASLVLKGVKIVEHGMGDGAAIKDRGGKVTIEDSEVEVIHDSTKGNFTRGNRGISVAGNSILKNIKIKTNAPTASGLVIESGTATINKVNVDSYHTALGINGGNVEITDTKTISENYHAIFVTNDTTETSVVINSGEYTGKWGLYASIDDGKQDNADVAVKVYDGIFTATNHAAALGANTKDSEHKWELQLIGGTYNTNVKNYIVSGFTQDLTGKIVPIA